MRISGAKHVRPNAVTAQRGAEVPEVMAQELAASLLDVAAHCVSGLNVFMVNPGAEDSEPAQLTPALMGDQVVGIVRALSLETKISFRIANA